MTDEITLTNDRGCGQRKKGGVYLTVSESPDGLPLSHFLIDPPIRVNLQELNIGPRGIHLVQKGSVWHVFDVVGRQHYPNVADFIEEANLLGISRRAELPDYHKLTAQSRLVLIHERGFIGNWAELYAGLSEVERGEFRCPSPFTGIQELHRQHSEMCAGLYWHDVEQMRDEQGTGCRISGVRDLPCGAEYRGWRADCNFFPEYQHAIFAIFPIGGIEVVADPDDKTHEAKLRRAQQAGLPVELVEG